MKLRSILHQVDKDMSGGGDPFEAVGADVRRLSGFRHVATTPSGGSFDIDEPVGFGGTGKAPDPAQYLLAALGASLSVTLTAHAAMRELAIDRVEVSVTGRIHGPSFFRPRSEGNAGILDLVVVLELTTSLSQSVLDELLEEVVLASPVYQCIKPAPRVIVKADQGAAHG
jgi:pyruvate dehydrogenase E2 component (dihydrolipoamide acetyltransferase)